MNSLRDIVETSPQLRELASRGLYRQDAPQPLGEARWDWADVKSVLVVRLRSIGDTVLATSSLKALKRFLPHARIDILLEDWVAPILAGSELVDRVVVVEKNSKSARLTTARALRASRYDVVFNLHGGTTATLLTRATGAKHRVGYASYQYSRLHQHLAPSPSMIWNREKTHSVEQQLALLGWCGVPVSDRPPTELTVTNTAASAVGHRLVAAGINHEDAFVLLHPTAAFATKQWAREKFARVAEHLAAQGFKIVALTASDQVLMLEELQRHTAVPVVGFSDFSLPQVTALASRAKLFLGNDSGIAHIAAALNIPSVVVFGSSNTTHWRPWTRAAAEAVLEEMDCQPCHGYFCEKFAQPECILRVPVDRVIAAVDRVLASN